MGLRCSDGTEKGPEGAALRCLPACKGGVESFAAVCDGKWGDQYYRMIVEGAASIIMSMDRDGRLTFINRFGLEFFGFEPGEILGRSVIGAIVPERESSGRDLKELIASICSEPDAFRTNENENMTRDGRRVWIAWTNSAIRQADGKVLGVLCVGNDITRRKKVEEELEYLGFHDILTGLFNRAFFEMELRRTPLPFGVIVCDLDGLKLVNDTLGHGCGDDLLRAAADLLRSSFREGDIVARVGGDEFAVLLRGKRALDVERAVRRIRRRAASWRCLGRANCMSGGVSESNHQPGCGARKNGLEIGCPSVPLLLSVGCATSSLDEVGSETALPEHVLRRADADMYAHKLRRRERSRRLMAEAIARLRNVRCMFI